MPDDKTTKQIVPDTSEFEIGDVVSIRLNGKIQEVKTVGRGYRKNEYLRSAFLYYCGGLDLYSQ